MITLAWLEAMLANSGPQPFFIVNRWGKSFMDLSYTRFERFFYWWSSRHLHSRTLALENKAHAIWVGETISRVEEPYTHTTVVSDFIFSFFHCLVCVGV